MKTLRLFCSGLVVSAGAAYGQVPGAATPTTTVTAKPQSIALSRLHKDTEENVCRWITTTGTRFGHRERHTAFEWRSISNDGAAYALYMQQRAGELQFGGH